ncbi:MAG: hydrogenase iron-sulfur subunit [Bacillota bacterium]
MSQAATTDVKIVAFCCENSAHQAAEDCSRRGLTLPAEVRIIKVPCAGKVDELYIMKAFEEGADGVCILACRTDACRYLRGNVRAQKRLAHAGEMLKEIGYSPDRVRYDSLAPHMSVRLSGILRDFIRKIQEMGEGEGEGEGGR